MFHKNLKKLRQEYDISAARIAKFLQVDEQDVIDWEAGVRKPTLNQIHQLADLFDISYKEIMEDEKSSSPSSKNSDKNKSGKKKTKKKHTKKQKTKKIKQKKVEKKRNWPLLVILIILLCAVGIGGYVYWKYGDEYSLIKKNTYTMDEMVGAFQVESMDSDIVPVLTLVSDGTYSLTTNTCNVAGVINGSWLIKDDTITLTSNSSVTYTLKINSTNKLKFTSDAIACAPKKNAIFTRGSASPSQESDEEDSTNSTTEEKEPISYIQVGSYNGNNSTLRITQVSDTNATFTLQSLDPNNASHIATLQSITGVIQGNTLTFSFADDGYGNAGNGTMVFDANQVVFTITLSTLNEEAEWSILTSGTLMK